VADTPQSMTDFLQLAASLKECGNSWGKRYHREKHTAAST